MCVCVCVCVCVCEREREREGEVYAIYVHTLTENMFPVCPVGMVTTSLLLKGSHNMADMSSEPDNR